MTLIKTIAVLDANVLYPAPVRDIAAGLCAFPEEYKYSSAKFYERGIDEFGFLTHWKS